MTKRQATYKLQSSDGSFVYSKIETPLNVVIGLYCTKPHGAKNLLACLAG